MPDHSRRLRAQVTEAPAEQRISASRIDVVAERDIVRVVAAGELDLAAAVKLGAQLHELYDAGFERVVLDLRELRRADAAAIGLIVSEVRLARGWRRDFSIIGAPPAIQRALDGPDAAPKEPVERGLRSRRA